MALQHAEELQNLRLDEKIQELNNKEITGSIYPQISASGQGTYYTNLPKIQFPNSNYSIYQVLQSEGVKDQNGNIITTNNASFSTQAISFQAPLNFQFGIAVNQMLFQPDIFVALKARDEVLQYNRANTKVAEERVKEAVQKAYYSVLIAVEQKRILEETLTRLDKLTNEMSEMFKSGFAEKLDIDKLTVNKNNATTAINQVANGINISKALLKNTIGLPMQDEIVLTEKLELQDLQVLLLESTDNFNYEVRKEIGLLNSARKLQEVDLLRQKSGYLPTVAAFYQFQRAGQRNPDFALPGKTPWFFFNTGLVGLSINQPIFDGFQKKYKIDQAELKLVQVDNSLKQLKRAIDMEQNIAKNSLSNALLNLDIQQRNSDLAREVFETTQIKYESGVGSSIELIQSDAAYQQAQGAYFQALYDSYVARIAYFKSVGRL
jgi:outer membrane protein TolC